MKSLGAVIASFLFIFFFSSVDNSVSPMIKEISDWYFISPEKALLFISACSMAVIPGLLAGPGLLAFFSPRRALLFSAILLSFSAFLFSFFSSFNAGLSARLFAGLASGVAASIMWWLAYHGVEKKHMGFMLATLMSARPLATAIGVPLAGLIAFRFDWRYPVWGLGFLMMFSGLWLYFSFPQGDGSRPEKKIFSGYVSALRTPFAALFYSGFFLNRMCYFGFYAFCGLWFRKHYGLDLRSISIYLFFIGLGEALINFFSAALVSRFGCFNTFLWPSLASFLLLPLFIFGKMQIWPAIFLIMLFMLLDRIYSMALVIRIPAMFSASGDKTAFGSLNTLSAWLAGSAVSAFFFQINIRARSFACGNVFDIFLRCWLWHNFLLSEKDCHPLKKSLFSAIT